ncbi:hypothetical protein [Chitinophaga deserti]|uniref:hypothetical protein n=1 Tax=Chitinophaga deserti TaxID=2164099 RepID=UPI0013008126|nr:hypothetical protein [Chitinophaga deserti]
MYLTRSLFLLMCAFVLVAPGCKKKKSGDPVPKPAEEAELQAELPGIHLNRDDNAAQGATLEFSIKLISNPLPPEGVTITITATDPSGAVIAQNPAYKSKEGTVSVSLINLPKRQVADIVVTVTSNNKPGNTKTYRFGVMNKTI